MKPLFLEIEGLNSFESKQSINFEKLTSLGIFGIFGPTGSGKSSILDGLIYAIYGRTPRGADLKSVINHRTKKLSVRYIFSIKGANPGIYQLQRTSRISKSGNLSGTAKLIKNQDKMDIKSGQVIADSVKGVQTAINDIIGLSFEEFTKTVVLPQGQFSGFLMAKNKDRKEILENIFSLQNYGEKLETAISADRRALEEKTGTQLKLLDRYEDINSQKLENAKKDIEFSEKEALKISGELDTARKDLSNYEKLLETKNALEQKNTEKQQILQQKSEIDEKRKQLELFKSIEKISPSITEYDGLNPAVKVLETRLQKLTSEKEELQKSFDIKTRAFQLADRERLRIAGYEHDIQKLQALKKDIVTLDEQKKDFQKLRQEISGIEQEHQKKTSELAGLKELLEKEDLGLKTNKMAIKELAGDNSRNEAIRNAYSLAENLKKNLESIKTLDKDHKALLENLAQTEADGKALKSEYDGITAQISETLKFELPEIYQTEIYLTKKEQFDKQLRDFDKKDADEKELARLTEDLKDLGTKAENLGLKLETEHKTYENIKLSIKNQTLSQMVFSVRNALEDGDKCPVCGGLYHAADFHDIEADSKDYQKLFTESEQRIKELTRQSNDISVLINASKQAESKLKEELKLLPDEVKTGDKQAVKEEFEAYKKNYEKAALEAKQNQQAYKALTEKKDLLNAKITKMRVEYTQIKTNADSKNSQKEALEKENRQLELKISQLSTDWEIQDIQNSYEVMNENLKKASELEKKIAVAEKKAEKLRNCISETENLTVALDKKAAEGKLKLQALSSSIDIIQKNLTSSGLAEDISVSQTDEKLESLANLTAEIKKNYAAAESELDLLRTGISQNLQDFQNTSGKLSEKKARLDRLKLEIKSFMSENGFTAPEELVSLNSRLSDKEKLEKEITDYNDRLKLACEHIKQLQSTIGGQNPDENILKQKQEKLAELEKSLSAVNEKTGYLKKETQRIKEELAEKEKLLSENKDAVKELGTVLKLQNLLKGRKYVQFLAKYNLSYVCRMASKLLYDITDGELAIVMDQAGDFYIRDYKNGGELRTPQTLSGGETFIVSMALAISLSTKVQLGGKALLEFFFLDEGFGSLDPDTLDKTLECLERLKSKNLSIGIISHVERIKNFVPIKLEVTPSTFGEGSKVTMKL